MTIIQYLAAALVIAGSALVLRAVWLADLDAPEATPIPKASAPPADEWREAA